MTPASPTPLTPEEQRKVKRSLIILYSAMALLTIIPFVVLWWVNRGK